MGLAQRIREFVDGPEEEEWEAEEELNAAASSSQVVTTPAFQPGCFEMATVSPRQFDEAVRVVEHIRQGRLVTVNLEGVPAAQAKRLVDFLSGACYARHGRMERISAESYIVLPGGAEFTAQREEY